MRVAGWSNKLIRFKLAEDELESIDQRVAELLQGQAWQSSGGRVWLTALESYVGLPDEPVEEGLTSDIPLASLDKDIKLTRASFGKLPGAGTPGWVWWLVGLTIVGLGGLLYIIRMWPRWQRGNW